MTRLLVVGCGQIATAGHLPALKRIQGEGGVEVVVCDIDRARAEAAGTRFEVPWTTDWEGAAADVQAVSVCLPPGPGGDVAVSAVEKGLHVLCEKPPGRDLAQAAAMAATAAAHPGSVTMVAFNRRFNPLYRRAMARSLQLGLPTAFYGRFSQPGLGDAPDDKVADWITSSGSHALDLAVATMGYPLSVSVSRRGLGTGPENSWTVQMNTERGAAVLLLHFAAGRRIERYEWAGAGYDVALEMPKRADWAQSGRDVETWGADSPAYHDMTGFTDEYRCFLAAVEGSGSRPAADFAYAPAFMRLVTAILAAGNGSVHELVAQSAPEPAPSAAPHTQSVPPDGTRPVVVIHQPIGVHPRFFSTGRLTALREVCDVRVAETPDDWAALKPAHALITGRGVKVPIPPDFADLAPDLGLMVVLGASVRGFAAESLIARGVTVTNTADAVAQSVAEHCLMLSLAGLRRLTDTDRRMHAGEWPRPGQPHRSRRDVRAVVGGLPLPAALRATLGRIDRRWTGREAGAAGGGGKRVPGGAGPAHDLRGLNVGLVGWGHTAYRFAQLLAPFGCNLLVATESGNPAEIEAVGARKVSMGEVLASCKVVSIHKGLTSGTRGFLGSVHLSQLEPGSVLVNAARGELIDEEALVARLASGDIVAALDVFAEEPLPRNHALRKLPNVILTPHHASTTAQEERRMGDEALDSVLAWAEGRPLRPIDMSRLEKMT